MTGRRVVITGGGGRLGSALARELSLAGQQVTVVDVAYPAWLYDPALGVRCVEADVLSVRALQVLNRILADAGTVVHLAGLHGLHLRQGARLADLWRSNTHGTRCVAEAAVAAGVQRMVLASTTALYGAGNAVGVAAVLDERRAPAPDNPYATSKLAAEAVMAAVTAGVMDAVALRMGRFFRPDEASYQLRKLSTGLDLDDAVGAVAAACRAETLPSGVYCAASDLPLPHSAREYLGVDCPAVLDEHLPGFTAAARQRGWTVPARVDRSVDSGLLQSVSGFRPCRTLAHVMTEWLHPASGANGTRPRTT